MSIDEKALEAAARAYEKANEYDGGVHGESNIRHWHVGLVEAIEAYEAAKEHPVSDEDIMWKNHYNMVANALNRAISMLPKDKQDEFLGVITKYGIQALPKDIHGYKVTKSEQQIGLVTPEEVRDFLRDTGGGHSVTNGNGDLLWHTKYPINCTLLVKHLCNQPVRESTQPDDSLDAKPCETPLETLIEWYNSPNASTANRFQYFYALCRHLKWLELQRAHQPERESGWQPIETAPKDGTTILASHRMVPSLVEPVYWDKGYCQWHNGHGLFADNYFTLWQPLPLPPTTDIEDETETRQGVQTDE